MKIENGVKYTEDFRTATDLENLRKRKIVLNPKTRKIKREAFANTSFKAIEFPEKFKTIGELAFSNSNLESLYIKNPVEIFDSAFEYNYLLKNIDINVEHIPEYCFLELAGNVDGGANIILRNTNFIGVKAFSYAEINIIEFPDTLKCIDNLAFYQAHFSDTVLYLPKGLEIIEEEAFAFTNLTDIYLPETVEYITNLDKSNIRLHMSEETKKR